MYELNGRMCIVYAMVKRTNINLDMGLVHEAARELGTERTTDTVHGALEDVVRRARRARMAGRDLDELTPERLSELREARRF